jgi:hypothetical protein
MNESYQAAPYPTGTTRVMDVGRRAHAADGRRGLREGRGTCTEPTRPSTAAGISGGNMSMRASHPDYRGRGRTTPLGVTRGHLRAGVTAVTAFVLAFSFVGPSFGQQEPPPATSPNTRVYIIKEGDTLWKISNDVYQDPSKWPLIWNLNPQIKDPNAIRPGEEVILEETKPAVAETPPAATEPESVIRKVPEEITAYPEVLPPPVAPATTVEEKYVMEPSDVYLIPKVLNEGFLTKEELDDSGYVDHTREDRKYVTDDNVVFIRLPQKHMLEVKRGDRYSIFRVTDKLRHPVTGKKIGYAIGIVGELEVTSVGAKTAGAVITDATDVIRIGDRIRPFEPTVKTIRVTKGKQPVVGYIVFSPTLETSIINDLMIAENNVVYIDRGYADGVDVGNVFDVLRLNEEYDRGKLTAEQYQQMLESSTVSEDLSSKGIIYPPDVVGELVVLNVGEYTSTAVITRSNATIKLGDMVRLQVE